MKTESFFSRPALAKGTNTSIGLDYVEVRHGESTFQLRGIPSSLLSEVGRWLRGAEVQDEPLLEGMDCCEPWHVPVLRALDDAGLLIERPLPHMAQSGVAVFNRIERRAARFEQELLLFDARGRFTTALQHGQATPALLAGNAIEYYFITLCAYDCIAPCLPRVSGPMQALLASFIIDEYRHDRIMLRAVEDSGLKEDELRDVVPLSYTSAITNQLFHYANNDPLSLLASLFVVEGKPVPGMNYVNALGRNGASAAYVDSHREHDRINTNGDHGTISRQAFKLIEHVSAEDEARITQRVLMLKRLADCRDRQMFAYYSNPENPYPRKMLAMRTSGRAAAESLHRGAASHVH